MEINSINKRIPWFMGRSEKKHQHDATRQETNENKSSTKDEKTLGDVLETIHDEITTKKRTLSPIY